MAANGLSGLTRRMQFDIAFSLVSVYFLSLLHDGYGFLRHIRFAAIGSSDGD
jgi:hypothetical protein